MILFNMREYTKYPRLSSLTCLARCITSIVQEFKILISHSLVAQRPVPRAENVDQYEDSTRCSSISSNYTSYTLLTPHMPTCLMRASDKGLCGTVCNTCQSITPSSSKHRYCLQRGEFNLPLSNFSHYICQERSDLRYHDGRLQNRNSHWC